MNIDKDKKEPNPAERLIRSRSQLINWIAGILMYSGKQRRMSAAALITLNSAIEAVESGVSYGGLYDDWAEFFRYVSEDMSNVRDHHVYGYSVQTFVSELVHRVREEIFDYSDLVLLMCKHAGFKQKWISLQKTGQKNFFVSNHEFERKFRIGICVPTRRK